MIHVILVAIVITGAIGMAVWAGLVLKAVAREWKNRR